MGASSVYVSSGESNDAMGGEARPYAEILNGIKMAKQNTLIPSRGR